MNFNDSSNKKILTRPRGTQDLFPPRALLFEKLRSSITKVLQLNSFHPLIFPTLEYEELFTKNLANSSVNKEMYQFSDRKGRKMVLRPEGTLSTMRLILQNKLHLNFSLFPGKYYYWANMFRYERPQKGRYREFWQLGVEIVGAKGLQADLCAIETTLEVLKIFSLKNFFLRVNYLGSKETQKRYETLLKECLDYQAELFCQNCLGRLQNPLRILDCQECQDRIKVPPYSSVLSTEEKRYVRELEGLLKTLAVPFTWDEKLVRGLDYYTGMVYEVSLKDTNKSLLGGGRYDELYKERGGVDLPSVGFALGVERLLEFLENQESFEKETLDFFFLDRSPPSLFFSLIVSVKNELIRQDYRVDYNLVAGEKITKELVFQRKKVKILVVFEKDKVIVYSRNSPRLVLEKLEREALIELLIEKIKAI